MSIGSFASFRQLCIFLTATLIFPIVGCDDQTLGPDTRGDIEGTVLNAETGDSLARANLTTTPPTQSFLTSDDGFFTIPNVETGNYTVTANRNGFSSESVTIRVEKNQTASALLQLDPNASHSQVDTAVTVEFNWRNESVNRDGMGPDSIFANVSYDLTNDGDPLVSQYKILFLIRHAEGPSRKQIEGDTLRPRGGFSSGEFRKHIPETADSVYIDNRFFKVED